MQPITYSVPKGPRAGAIGGFIGSIVLGVTGEIGAIIDEPRTVLHNHRQEDWV